MTDGDNEFGWFVSFYKTLWDDLLILREINMQLYVAAYQEAIAGIRMVRLLSNSKLEQYRLSIFLTFNCLTILPVAVPRSTIKLALFFTLYATVSRNL